MAFMESQSPVDVCLLEERSVCYIYISCARGQTYKYITTSRDFGPGGGGGGDRVPCDNGLQCTILAESMQNVLAGGLPGNMGPPPGV